MLTSPTLGVMLDCSRNAVYHPKALYRFIDLISAMGYNTLQLYTEDTYEVEGEPFFGYMRGRYTKEELRAIDAYAAKKGVELQPCIQTLAHLATIFRWDDYRAIHDQGGVLLVDEERTYELIDRMFASCAECFTSRRIHIGMDEAMALGRGKYLDMYGPGERKEILLKHLSRVAEIARRYGFRPMVWGDMFYRVAAGGWYGHRVDPTLAAEIGATIPEDIDLVHWDYYHTSTAMYDTMLEGYRLMKPKDGLMFAGGAWTWSGITPHNGYSIRTMEAALPACRKHGVRDIYITMWGDDGGECSAFGLLPSLFYMAELVRGNCDMRSIKARFAEIVGAEFDDMMALDLPDGIGTAPYAYANPSKYGLYNDPFRGIMDKNLVEGGARYFARTAKRMRALARKGGEFAYLFDEAAKLSSVLEVKYDLGVRAREAYRADDREALATVATDLSRARKRLAVYYRAYADGWRREKKPHGFEVQEARIGGMLLRLESCEAILKDYLAGRVEAIEELTEEILPLKTEPRSWREIFTASVL